MVVVVVAISNKRSNDREPIMKRMKEPTPQFIETKEVDESTVLAEKA